jgi:uncharacterized protein (TIGR02391 family)
MNELHSIIPDADVLMALQPEELGAKLLFLLRKRAKTRLDQSFLLSNLLMELWPLNPPPFWQSPYQGRKNEINLALAEAWAWLVAQGLLVPAPEDATGSWRVLSRRAQQFEDEAEFAQFAIARMLPKDFLNPRISKIVWLAFVRGEYDVAVFQAMKAVEVAVREVSGFSDSLIGVSLMRKAFDPQGGPLTDDTAEQGEKQARSDLFAGAIGSYKNPHSHRDVKLDDPAEAAEIIMLANHLLRIVDVKASTKP